MENQMKLLMSAFIAILIGVVLIQSIGTDVELVKIGSRTILNESVALTVTTTAITNETLTFVDVTTLIENETVTLTGNITGTLANDNLTELTALRNITSENLLGFCNITLSTGALVCNNTRGSETAYANYTYVSEKTETLANNYLTELTALRNVTSENILGWCNITLATGALVCNNTYSTVGYADYTYNDYSTGELTYDELISFDACRNSTMTAVLANIHCNVTLTVGEVKVTYDNFTDNLAYIDYKYEPDDYVHNSAARSMLTVTVLLFAIAIILVGIGFVIAGFKQSGVM